MLAPKRVKFRKQMKGRMRGYATRGATVAFGHFGLQATEAGWVSNRQIEAARVAMTREMKRGGKLWIRVFPDKPITKKPAETRMGHGKGNVEEWVAVVKMGRMLYEMEGVTPEIAKEAMALASHKLPLHTRMVSRSATGSLRRVRIAVRGLVTLTPLHPVVRRLQAVRRRPPAAEVVELGLVRSEEP